MKNKIAAALAVIVLAILFVVATNFYKKSEDQKIENLSASSSGAPFVRDHSPSFGENKNNVVIVEFLDPQCEACKAFHPVIKKVFKEYQEESKLVIRYLANHGNSKFVVRLLESARKQNKYNEALEVIFNTQDQWANHNNPQPQLLWTFLPQTGLDMVKLRSDFDSNYIDGMLNLDRNDAQSLNVRGTPTFFVNGKMLKKLSYQSLLDLVESELYK